MFSIDDTHGSKIRKRKARPCTRAYVTSHPYHCSTQLCVQPQGQSALSHVHMQNLLQIVTFHSPIHFGQHTSDHRSFVSSKQYPLHQKTFLSQIARTELSHIYSAAQIQQRSLHTLYEGGLTEGRDLCKTPCIQANAILGCSSPLWRCGSAET